MQSLSYEKEWLNALQKYNDTKTWYGKLQDTQVELQTKLDFVRATHQYRELGTIIEALECNLRHVHQARRALTTASNSLNDIEKEISSAQLVWYRLLCEVFGNVCSNVMSPVCEFCGGRNCLYYCHDFTSEKYRISIRRPECTDPHFVICMYCKGNFQTLYQAATQQCHHNFLPPAGAALPFIHHHIPIPNLVFIVANYSRVF